MKIFKNKIFYVSIFAAAIFVTSTYYFVSNTGNLNAENPSVAQQPETNLDTTTAQTPTPTIQGYEAVSAGTLTPEAQNVSHTKRPVVIYVRRVDDPILCGEEDSDASTGGTSAE